jgi:ATP-grasp ribosomal peptide maturase
MVLTQPYDFTSDVVIKRLYERDVDVTRFDSGWFPRDALLTAQLESGVQEPLTSVAPVMGKPWELAQVASIWMRRPRDFLLDERLNARAAEFARNEARAGLGGVLRSASSLWVNHPEKEVTACYKPLQLTVAARLGLSIPRTIITNDPGAARTFIETNRNGTIYKTLHVPFTMSDDGPDSLIFTSIISPDDLAALASIRYTPCLMQEWVPKAFELRATVIDGRIFTAALRTDGTPAVDWRTAHRDLEYFVYVMPQRVNDLLLRLVHELGLVFATADFIVTPDGDHVFLEVNPSGQWAWLEPETGLPLIDAMADCLAPFSAAKPDR